MIGALHRVTRGLLVAFAVVALALGYWVIVRGDGLLARDDNPRRVLAEQRIQRGQILDRNGVVLSESAPDPDTRVVRRHYPYPEVAPVVGYYSLRYGAGGVEAEQNRHLSGEAQLTPFEELARNLLHRPPVGGDVQLTLDLGIQQAAASLLDGRRGAIVVLTAPGGEVLALASAPTFDPNQLDENWDSLVASADAPLLNRATQGAYQPGTILQSVVLGAALNTGVATPEESWSGPLTVQINDTMLPCAQTATGIDTLGESFLAACPAPYQAIAQRIRADRLDNALADFGLLEPPPFALLPESGGPIPSPAGADLAATAIGQSGLTVSPLQMALVAAAYADHGQMPALRLVESTRLPGAPWQLQAATGNPRGTVSRASADAVAALMEQAVLNGAARAAAQPASRVHGHAGLAVSGPEGAYNAWFIGYAYRAPDDAIAVAVLIEDTPDAREAARIGGQVLQAALLAHP